MISNKKRERRKDDTMEMERAREETLFGYFDGRLEWKRFAVLALSGVEVMGALSPT